ncbi:DciA family protein [Nocardioides sp. S-58]|uniref:DciA family protein n=1 Tax=Nocardioides renjunii TaxID=3095075 RepID=A0ABU5K950_9ACTN|nr:DciA family protein [Nocardioides sp. S-58]MDZ5661387.1 DciA family protein [Nocardioides sp. S-58]
MSDERPDPPHEADGGEVAEPGADPAPEHQPDGLDLARAAARAAAASAGTPPARRPASRTRRRTTTTSSGARPDDRDPQLLEQAMGRLVANHGWELDLKVQGVFGRWAELVGDEVADHCTPESFDDGRLVVRTDSTAWATQLKLLAPTVVRRLNEELGHGTVTLIEVLGPHLPSWKKGRLSSRDGRGPRDTYG